MSHPNAAATIASAGAAFGKATKAKLTDKSIDGEPEDQLRAPLEQLVKDMAQLSGFRVDAVTLIGETRLADLKTRPDFAVEAKNAFVGFIELKAPGKGGDPRTFTGHDAVQWEKLQPLPNLIYTDGNEWSLWRSGQLEGEIIRVHGDVRTSGAALELPAALLALFESFLNWEPLAPRDAQQLAETTAKLCKLLRFEVAEQLALKDEALTDLAKEWRRLLFPEADNDAFADGYAQAVTFGLLMARARGIKLELGLDHVAKQLRQTNSLIGSALRLLTDDARNKATLTTSLDTLVRVLDVVDWSKVSKGKPDAWLYFYEDFLAEYDNELRKQTGSYYTPPDVVTSMVRLVHEALKSRFAQPAGLASPSVTIADPAVGTGTFPLGVLKQIADAVREDEGEGQVPAAVEAAIGRLIAFEMQLGPFAVAQLRVTGELGTLMKRVPKTPLRMYVTDTLGNPYHEMEHTSVLVEGIAESRRQANEVKKKEKITVVIGNPPYKEKAKGKGSWIEEGSAGQAAALDAWIPPADWGVGAHAKHLRNLYIYFWRWATWKVFDHQPAQSTGVVCFITVAGFLNGPGFQRMRDYLRRTATDIWVIDCSPEGHQPGVNTRIFQGVQQEVCIVMVARASATDGQTPAKVRFRALPKAHRTEKFDALAKLGLDDAQWDDCPTGWREPFLPAAAGAWATYPKLEDFFLYNGSGVQTKRTWVIAPDCESLIERWDKLIEAPEAKKEALFHPTLRGGVPADRHIRSIVRERLPGFELRITAIVDEKGSCTPPVMYGFRSFNRQWIIPDPRVITQPNAQLWTGASGKGVFLTAPHDQSPSGGPALTLTAHVPDLHHYNGRGGRVFPLWYDAAASHPNVSPAVCSLLGDRLKRDVSPEDLFAYIAAVAAQPAYTARFKEDLVQPGLRIPLTADATLFHQAAALGREVVWLHTFGERFADPKADRPAAPPRLPKGKAPKVPTGGAIGEADDGLPNDIGYDEASQTLTIGERGRIEHVTPAMWAYEVSGKHVLTQWFSYRKRNRSKPSMGDRRPPSKLSDIQPAGWPAEYTTELLNVLNVLGRLVLLEPKQEALLNAICTGDLINAAAVNTAVGAQPAKRKKKAEQEAGLFSGPSSD